MKNLITLILMLSALLLTRISPAQEKGGKDSKQGDNADSLKKIESIYDDGLWMIGHDDKFRITAWTQEDARLYNNDISPSTMLNRRTRVGVMGTLEKSFNYQVVLALERSTDILQFAWVDYTQLPYFQVRFGQFKQPYSREELTPDGYLDILERSIAISNFSPAQDLGIMVHGKVLGDAIEYGLGVFNGRGKNNMDNNNSKDIAGRLDINPLKNSDNNLLKGLFFGFSFTNGKQNESMKGFSVKTAGQTKFFTFNDSVNISDSKSRYGTDVEWIAGPASLKGEWNRIEFKNLSKDAIRQDISFTGWFASASYMITGENKLRNKSVIPKHDFNPLEGHWGALELTGRYEQFNVLNNPIINRFGSGTEKVNAISGGLNWSLNRHVRFS